MTLQNLQPKTKLQYCLEKIFGEVGVTLITQISKRKGIWKLGKTDISLYLSQLLLKYGIVSEVASNINTFGHYPQIADLISLRSWLHKVSQYGGKDHRTVKLYILDELNVHAPRRRAMSRKNIGILQIIPEISKARARLILIGHEILKMDKDLTSFGIVRGLFIKKSLKSVELISHLLRKKYVFNDVPRTTIRFDPYETAPFTMSPLSEIMFNDEDLQKFYKWAKGGTWREFFKNPNECNRFVRRISLRLLQKAFTDLQS